MLAPGLRRQCCLCKSTRSTHRRATVVVVQTPEPARKPWRMARTRTAPPPKRLMMSDGRPWTAPASSEGAVDEASSPPSPARRPYHCASCGRAFRYACNLRAHMAAHARAPVAAFSCPECRAAFPHAYQLTDHLREHALLQQQVQLQEQVARQMEEQMLLQQQLEEQFMIQQAYITQTAFGASLGLGWGAMAPVAPTPIRCVCLECGREFLQRSALRQHMKEHETKHNKESPRRIRKWPKMPPPPPPEPSTSPTAFFRCGCGAAFDTPQALHEHRAVHVRKKPFRCSQCPADFSNPWNLARHYKEHLRHLCVLSLSDLRCHVCNENFRSDEVELRRHRALHKDVRFCKCRCGATFRSGWDWEQHVITCTTPPAA